MQYVLQTRTTSECRRVAMRRARQRLLAQAVPARGGESRGSRRAQRVKAGREVYFWPDVTAVHAALAAVQDYLAEDR